MSTASATLGHSGAAPSATPSATPSVTPLTNSTSSTKFSGFTVPSILTWKDPAKTGALFGQVFLTWVVLSSSLALRLFLRVSTYLLLLLSGLEASTRMINGANNGLIGSYRFSRFLPREQAIQTISSTVAKDVRSIMYGVEYVLDARSPALDFKLAIAAWTLYKILGVVSVSTLTLITILATFTLPVVYLQFKPQIDQAIGDMQGHIQVQKKQFEKTAHEKAGPQIEFVQKLLNKRGRGGLSTGSATTPGHSGAGAAGVGAAGVGATGVGSTGVGSTGVGSTGHSGVGATGPAGARSTGSDFTPATHASPSFKANTTAPGATGATGASTASPSFKTAGAGVPGTNPANSSFSGVTGPATLTHPTTEEVLSKYDTVPTLAGNVKLDPYRVDQFQTDAQALRDSIKQDKPAH